MTTFGLLVFLGIFTISYCYDQSVSVEGVIICHGNRYAGAMVYLMEEDMFDPDDQLAKVATSLDGKYKLQGWENELKPIEPYLKIVHTCSLVESSNRRCERVLKVKIPTEAISEDRIISKFFTINDIELGDRRPSESSSCKNW